MTVITQGELTTSTNSEHLGDGLYDKKVKATPCTTGSGFERLFLRLFSKCLPNGNQSQQGIGGQLFQLLVDDILQTRVARLQGIIFILANVVVTLATPQSTNIQVILVIIVTVFVNQADRPVLVMEEVIHC